MRHLFFAILSLAGLCGAAQVEPTGSPGDKPSLVKVGFKAGLNRSNVRGVESDGDRTGFVGVELYGSVFTELRLQERLKLGGELLFSWTDEYHFLELPIQLKYRLARSWDLFAGPKLDYITTGENSFSGLGYEFNHLGISGELGAQFYILKNVFAEARIARSFTEQITDTFLDINKGKRHTIRVGVGIRL